MKTYKYSVLAILLLMGIGLQAQTFDKKVSESFKVNSNVEVVVDANNTDVTIETWNKNEVEIEAVMEVEGVTKEEASKILASWEFEALGNSNKVKITSRADGMNFNLDFHEMDIDIPEMDFEIPEIDFPEIEIPEIVFPEIDFSTFEFPEMPDFEEIEFDYDAYKTDSTYLKQYKEQVAVQVERFKKSDWKEKMDSIRNTEEYKRNVHNMKRASKEIQKELKEVFNSREYKEAMEQVEMVTEQVTKELLANKEYIEQQTELTKEATKKAWEMIEKMREDGTFDSIQNFSENIYFHYGDSKNSKIKIRKSIKVKVPKNATFDLQVRHGKLNVPDSNKKMSAVISYGDFVGGVIVGKNNELRISNSPVSIEVLNSGNVTLKNVPKATFGAFSNANLFSNSSDVFIEVIGENADVSHKFGNLEISKVTSNFNSLNLILDYSKASVNISDSNFVFHINNKKSTLNMNGAFTEIDKKHKDGVDYFEGFYNKKSSSNKLYLTAIYSSVDLK